MDKVCENGVGGSEKKRKEKEKKDEKMNEKVRKNVKV